MNALRRRHLSDELRSRLGERILVSSSGCHIFLYAGTMQTATRAGRVARDVLDEHELQADLRIEHWHPMEEVWDVSPEGMRHNAAKERRAKHENEQQWKRQRSLHTGLPEWTVRAALSSHHDAVALAARLSADGDSVVRRWKYLIVGATCEDDANTLARKIRGYAPAGTSIHAERVGADALQDVSFHNLKFTALPFFPPGP